MLNGVRATNKLQAITEPLYVYPPNAELTAKYVHVLITCLMAYGSYWAIELFDTPVLGSECIIVMSPLEKKLEK